MKFVIFGTLLGLVAANGEVFFHSGPHCTGSGSGPESLNPDGVGHCFKTHKYRSFTAGPCPGRVQYNGFASVSEAGVCQGKQSPSFYTKSGKRTELPKISGGTIITCHLKHNADDVDDDVLWTVKA